jgi:hypothetical protein
VDEAEFDLFGSLLLNGSGDTAFNAVLRTGGGPNAGVVDNTNALALFGPTSGAGSPLGLLVREGDAAPGVNDGAEFASFGYTILNAAGDMAFAADLRTGTGPNPGVVNGANDSGLFALVGGKLSLIVREDDLFEVISPETMATEFKTIAEFTGFGSYGSFDFNDAGLLAFTLQFSDGTSGAFTVDIIPVPEPTYGLLSVLALVAMAIRRR